MKTWLLVNFDMTLASHLSAGSYLTRPNGPGVLYWLGNCSRPHEAAACISSCRATTARCGEARESWSEDGLPRGWASNEVAKSDETKVELGRWRWTEAFQDVSDCRALGKLRDSECLWPGGSHADRRLCLGAILDSRGSASAEGTSEFLNSNAMVVTLAMRDAHSKDEKKAERASEDVSLGWKDVDVDDKGRE